MPSGVYKRTIEHKNKISELAKRPRTLRGGGYQAIHKWIKRYYGKSNKCENKDCKNISKIFEWALIKGKKHEHNRENYKMLCKVCHMNYDIVQKTKNNIATTKMKGKKILQYSKDKKLIKKWDNLCEIKYFLKINKEAVLNCLIGRAKTSAGFIWKYE